MPTQNRFAPLESIEPEYASLAYLDVEICYPGAKEWNTTRAMLDCGGQGSFINKEFCQVYQIPQAQVLKPTPLPLILADGQSSRGGDVTHYTPLLLNIGGNVETITLDTSTTAHDVILGIPWLSKHNPSINWVPHQRLLLLILSIAEIIVPTMGKQSNYTTTHFLHI